MRNLDENVAKGNIIGELMLIERCIFSRILNIQCNEIS
jgi:hypothetical protein